MQQQSIETIPIFISKLYEILNVPHSLIQEDNHSKIICWTKNEKEFQVHNIEQLQKSVLPKYFRHHNINSFIRQLNMYGFHKSRKDSSKIVFSHPNFMKGQCEMLTKIKRKVKNEFQPSINETLRSQQQSSGYQFSKLIQSGQQEQNMLQQMQNNVNTQQKNHEEEINVNQILPSLYQINNPSMFLIDDNKGFIFQDGQSPSTLKCFMQKSVVFDHNPEIYSPKQYRVTIDRESKIKLGDCQSDDDDDGTSLAGDIFMTVQQNGSLFKDLGTKELFEQ